MARKATLSEVQSINSGTYPYPQQVRVNENTGDILIETTPKRVKKGNKEMAKDVTEQTVDEMINHIEATQPELLGGKKQKKLSAKEQKAQEEADRIASFELVPVPDEQIHHRISLSSLIKIGDTPIKNGKLAMREINQDRLESMYIAFRRGEKFPEIKVQASTWGFILVDGGHREEMYLRFIADTLKEHGLQEGSDDFLNALETRANEFEIDVEEVNITDPRKLVKAVFEANMRHGMPMSPASRSKYAIWLLEDAKEHGEKMYVSTAAEIAGVTRVAVHRMLQRMEKKEKLMVDSFVEPEDLEEIEKTEKEDKKSKESNDTDAVAKKFMQAIVTLDRDLHVENTDEMIDWLVEYLGATGISVQLDTMMVFGIALERLSVRLSNKMKKQQEVTAKK